MKVLLLVCGSLLLAALTAGCAPTERYYTDKTPQASQPPAMNPPGPCSMATPVTRLQSRSSYQRSVEGFQSLPCVAPTAAGKR